MACPALNIAHGLACVVRSTLMAISTSRPTPSNSTAHKPIRFQSVAAATGACGSAVAAVATTYDQKDAGGFIKLNALRMRIAANLSSRKGQD